MTESLKALLVFCEGPHDIGYVRIILRKILSFEMVQLPFKELPSPFHHLFKKSVETYAAGELSLDMSDKYFLPDKVLRKNNQFVFLFSCGGNSKYDKIKKLLSDYLPAFSEARTFAQGAPEIVDTFKYLFIYDADAVGIDVIIKNLNTNLGVINTNSFIDKEEWCSSSSEFGKIAGDKAVYIWGEKPDKGTLEDILYPMYSLDNSSLLSRAESAIDDMFFWDINNQDIKKAIPEISRRKKSILTVIGQKEKPGCSLNVIIDQSSLLRKDILKNNVPTQNFVNFISEFIDIKL